MLKLTPVLASMLLLSACADYWVAQPATPSGSLGGQATLQVQPQIVPGGLAVQAVVDNYTVASVNHLVVKLFKLNGNSELPVLGTNNDQLSKDVPQAQLGMPIAFSNLNANTTYRIRAYAYKAAGLAGGDLISTSDVSSYLDVTLANDDRPTLTNLRVKLIDVHFNGQATASSVTVTNGGLITSGTETIQ